MNFAGFKPYRRTGLVINVNRAQQGDVTLQVADLASTVEVNKAAQVQVEKADTQPGLTIASSQVSELPLNGRAYKETM